MKLINSFKKLSRTSLMIALIPALLLGILGGLIVQSESNSDSIWVNTTDDEDNHDGDCSLREAIRAANTDRPADACRAGSGDDTIILPVGRYKVSPERPLEVHQDLSITGTDMNRTIIEIERTAREGIRGAFKITAANFTVSELSMVQVSPPPNPGLGHFN